MPITTYDTVAMQQVQGIPELAQIKIDKAELQDTSYVARHVQLETVKIVAILAS